MHSALSAARSRTTTQYNKSPSLYGGDQIDDELDTYFNSPTQHTRTKKQKKHSTNSHTTHNNKSAQHTRNSTSKPSTLSFSPAFASALNDDDDDTAAALTAQPIQGTNQSIEKDYYRLTSAPQPAAVRPPHILAQSLSRVKQRWKTSREYGWCCSQLKSIRQDLTVQHVRDTFACECYETHGRIALEHGDLNEFTALMTPLTLLHSEGHTPLHTRAEFTAYRILLSCHHKRHNDLSLLALIDTLPAELTSHPYIQHALAVRQSLLLRSYLEFFRLYQNAPVMSSYLMDGLAGEMRMRALRVVCTAFRPSCQCEWVRRWVGFETEDECVQWLVSMGVDVVEEVVNADVSRWSFDAKAALSVVQLYDDRGLRIQDQH